MAEGREILTARLSQQLGMLVSSVEIAIRNNLSSSNVVAETTLAGLLNLVYGWNLVNANSISQNSPGVDLIDTERKIAIQVTSTRSMEKVRHTQKEVAKLGVTFERLIILIITNQAPTPAMTSCTIPGYTGSTEVWNIPDIFRIAKELDIDILREITVFMNKELGFTRVALEELPHLELPASSKLQASGFVGREEELAEIHRRFEKGDHLVVVTGLGGIGKTELATQYGQLYSSMVYFVRFDTSFTRTLANMARGIRPKLSENVLRQQESVLCSMVLRFLEKSKPKDLLIIDNVDSETETLADLQNDPNYNTLTNSPLKLLVTTRSYTPRSVQVSPMPNDDLIQIFQNHGADLTVPEMTDLIHAVNGHTMTIDLMARTLNGQDWRIVTAADLLTALRENTLPSQEYQKIITDYKQSPTQAQIYTHMSVVFDVSGIPDTGKSVLCCATLLPKDGMNARLFGSSFRTKEQDSLDILLNRGWLGIRNGLITIHPIIRLVCQTETPPTDEVCTNFLEALVVQCSKKDLQMDLYRQMAELLTNASRYLKDAQGSCALVAGELWRNLGDYGQALDCDLRAKSILERTLPSDDPTLALIYNNIGCNYHYMGDHHESLEYHQKALDIRKKVLSADNTALALSYDNAGSAYNSLGEHEKALEFQQKALVIMENALPPGHADLAEYYSNIGVTLGALDDHCSALEYYRKAMEITENILPPEHPHLAHYFNNAGYSYSYLGDHHRAMEYQLKALAIRKAILPANHPDIALSCSNIAWLYHAAGSLREAAHYMRRAAEIIVRTSLPKTHPNQVNYPKWADQFENDAKLQLAMIARMKG